MKWKCSPENRKKNRNEENEIGVLKNEIKFSCN